MPVRFGVSGHRRATTTYIDSNVVVQQTTLSDYLQKQEVESYRRQEAEVEDSHTRVLIEHGRCGALLGVHKIYSVRTRFDRSLSRTDENRILIDKDLARSRANRRLGWNLRDPMTTPCVLTGYGDASGSKKHYAYVWCTCLPPGHEEKVSQEKFGEMLVSFPDWKWGRPIQLPVLTI